MIKNIEELKALIAWAKREKVQHLKVGDVEFTLSTLAFPLDDLSYGDTQQPLSDQLSKLDNIETERTEDEDLLYWSSS